MSYFLRFICLTFLLSAHSVYASTSVLNIQQWHSKNGVNVLFVRTPRLPILDLRLIFRAGSSNDRSQYGLAALTNNLLDQGAGNLSADDIAAQFDSVGAIFSNSVGRDQASVGLRTLSARKYLRPALNTFVTVLSQPRFSQKTFDREQARTLRGITAQEQVPAYVATRALFESLYGNQPYGHPINGTRATVNNLQRVDVKKFYEQYYTRNQALLVMVGNLSKKRARQISEKITRTLRDGKTQAKLGKQTQQLLGEARHVERNIPQTAIRIGQVAIARNNPHYFPLSVGNKILGSGMVSRLFDEIRVKRGLSYGAYTHFVTYASEGPFMVSLQTKTKSTQEAIDVTQKVIKRFIAEGPTDEELSAAKQNLIGGFPIKLSSNRAILNALVTIGFYDLPPDYLDTYRLNISAVDKAAVKAAFSRHVHPQDFVTVTVGRGTGHQHAAS